VIDVLIAMSHDLTDRVPSFVKIDGGSFSTNQLWNWKRVSDSSVLVVLAITEGTQKHG
jgi:hypothetical protein